MDESNTFCVYFSMASGYTVLKMKDCIKSCSDSSSFRERPFNAKLDSEAATGDVL